MAVSPLGVAPAPAYHAVRSGAGDVDNAATIPRNSKAGRKNGSSHGRWSRARCFECPRQEPEQTCTVRYAYSAGLN